MVARKWIKEAHSGAQLVKFERGRRYIFNRKEKTIHGLNPSVKV